MATKKTRPKASVDANRYPVLAARLYDVGALVTDPRNAMEHDQRNIDVIKASLKKYGQRKNIVIAEDGTVKAGNGTLEAARQLGWTQIVGGPAPKKANDAKGYALVDNRSAQLATWNRPILGEELKLLIAAEDYGLPGVGDLGFSQKDVSSYLRTEPISEPEIPEPPKVAVCKPGQLWQLGRHRLVCGDSLNPHDVARAVNDQDVHLVHADPPYGMGKESDGVENDNLYAAKLTAFLMGWWTTCRLHLVDNASVYIWGNPEALWRLWYGGLKDSERITFRNEIVWNKGSGMGMSAAASHQFATATERCLFFMLGEQVFGNVNLADYWEWFEPIRSYLAEEVEKIGWDAKRVADLCGVGMFGHWFTKSQWVMIPAKHYETLQTAAKGKAFAMPYPELRARYYQTRAYFENTHDVMTDVWEFPRVLGDERFGHATPKPVAMMSRAILSSCPEGGVVYEPFAGTGTTLMAAEQTGRTCGTLELSPIYCDVIIERWQQATGQKAACLEGGKPRAARGPKRGSKAA